MDNISELQFYDSESEWSDSEHAGNDEIGVRTAVPVTVGNNKVNYWNKLHVVQLVKHVNL